MPDGRLDFPDAMLEPLDIVLASLHDSASHDAETLTRRAIQAIRHPLVTIFTHPANRIVGRREGYPLDFDALYAAAAETGTALEVDGAPSHIDLDGEHARAAIAAGVTLTIDSDCHRARLARPPDAVRDRHGAARLGRAAPRAQRASARGGPRVHRRQTCASLEERGIWRQLPATSSPRACRRPA